MSKQDKIINKFLYCILDTEEREVITNDIREVAEKCGYAKNAGKPIDVIIESFEDAINFAIRTEIKAEKYLQSAYPTLCDIEQGRVEA